MKKISCLIIETDQEAIRHIDILGRTMGSLDLRWKTNSLETGVAIIRKHLPEMAIVGLGQNPNASIEGISALARDYPSLYILALSDKSDSDLILRAMRAGAHDFLLLIEDFHQVLARSLGIHQRKPAHGLLF